MKVFHLAAAVLDWSVIFKNCHRLLPLELFAMNGHVGFGQVLRDCVGHNLRNGTEWEVLGQSLKQGLRKATYGLPKKKEDPNKKPPTNLFSSDLSGAEGRRSQGFKAFKGGISAAVSTGLTLLLWESTVKRILGPSGNVWFLPVCHDFISLSHEGPDLAPLAVRTAGPRMSSVERFSGHDVRVFKYHP